MHWDRSQSALCIYVDVLNPAFSLEWLLTVFNPLYFESYIYIHVYVLMDVYIHVQVS